MGSKILQPPTRYFSRDEYVIFDEFTSYTDTQLWTKAVAANGTVTHEGSVGRSTMKLFATTIDDAAVLATTNEMFIFKASKAMCAETCIQYTEVNTDDTSVYFGWADALAATTISDGGLALAMTDGCGIFKLKDSTYWQFHTEINNSITGIGGAAVDSISDTVAGGTAFQTLRIEIVPRSASVLEARPLVDGVYLKTSGGLPIMHTITLGTATELDFGIMTKGEHANDFNLYCDYLYAAQVRG